MPKVKKDGAILNCYIRKDIMERLDKMNKNTDIPKTSGSLQVMNSIAVKQV